MHDEQLEPQVFRVLQGEALDIHRSPTGHVGRVFSGEGLEAVWVAKQQEVIDTEWFSMPSVGVVGWYVTSTSRAAATACSWLSATTIAMCWPW